MVSTEYYFGTTFGWLTNNSPSAIIMAYKQTKEHCMNLKVKAAAIMAGIFAGTIAVQGVLVLAAEKYGTQAIVNTFVCGILVFLIYQVYTVILANLESKEAIKKMTERG
jgi:Na+/phosphate symporter